MATNRHGLTFGEALVTKAAKKSQRPGTTGSMKRRRPRKQPPATTTKTKQSSHSSLQAGGGGGQQQQLLESPLTTTQGSGNQHKMLLNYSDSHHTHAQPFHVHAAPSNSPNSPTSSSSSSSASSFNNVAVYGTHKRPRPHSSQDRTARHTMSTSMMGGDSLAQGSQHHSSSVISQSSGGVSGKEIFFFEVLEIEQAYSRTSNPLVRSTFFLFLFFLTHFLLFFITT